MRKCLTKFSLIVECGAVQKYVKRRISVNLVDLVKSFQTSIYLQILASIQPRIVRFTIQLASRERASQSLPKIAKVRIKVRTSIGTMR